MFTKAMLKRTIWTILVFFILSGVALAPQTAQASLLGDTLKTYAETYTLVKLYYEHAYDHWQGFFKSEYAREAGGVSKDPQANAMLDRIMNKLVNQAKANGERIRVPYTWFVGNQKEMNAFAGFSNIVECNQGTFAIFNYNEDEIAFVMAHEVTHVQEGHLLKDLNKIIAYEVLAKVFANRYDNKMWSQIVAYSAVKNIIAKTVTMKHEIAADEGSWTRAVALGYNPGAASAAWTKVYDKYGDYHRTFLNVLLSPNDHPTTSARVKNFAAKMTAYSGNHVAVSGAAVLLDGKEVLACVKTASELAGERAYLVAGGLSRAYHDGAGAIPATIDEDGRVMIGKYPILTPAAGEPDAQAITARLDEIRGLAAKAPPPEEPVKDSPVKEKEADQ